MPLIWHRRRHLILGGVSNRKGGSLGRWRIWKACVFNIKTALERYVLEVTGQHCRLRQMNWSEAPKTLTVLNWSRQNPSQCYNDNLRQEQIEAAKRCDF